MNCVFQFNCMCFFQMYILCVTTFMFVILHELQLCWTRPLAKGPCLCGLRTALLIQPAASHLKLRTQTWILNEMFHFIAAKVHYGGWWWWCILFPRVSLTSETAGVAVFYFIVLLLTFRLLCMKCGRPRRGQKTNKKILCTK